MLTDPVLQPLAVNQLTLKNRIYSTGHAPSGYLVDGRPETRYALYHEEKAKGGIGLTIIGGSSNVAIDSANVFDQINGGDDRVLPFYEDISQRVHAYGAAVMIQLTHLGRRSRWDIGDWLPAIGPSPVRERSHRSYPKPIEEFDVRRIIRAYGDAVKRAQRGGLDGVELAAMAGHLIDQFWAPRTNQRDDGYGGSLRNRMRFAIDVLENIREQVGPSFAVGMRIPGDEGVKGGLTHEECIDIASTLSRTGLVDFFSVVYGGANTDRELSGIIPPFGRALGEHLDIAGALRKEVDVPVFHAGRIADLATARHALTAGYADLIGMTRAHIADPHIVRKLLAGQEEQIRPCVGATYCASRVETFCLHNPATGREATIPQLVEMGPGGKRVVVVGGGPGGLEAARVAAERGHSVVLFEADAQVGGQVRMASRTTRHAEKLGIIDWLAGQVALRGVQVRTNTYVEAADVLAELPDVVVVATGGLPNTQLPGGGEELVQSTWDVMSSAPTPGERVLLFDDHGGEQAITAAERLASAGCVVELVTPDRMVAHDVAGVIYPDYFRILYAAGAVFTPDHVLVSVRRSGAGLVAVLANAFTDELVERTVDRVVVEQGTLPVAEVYEGLIDRSQNLGELDLDAFVEGRPQQLRTNPDGEYQLFRIGDAVASRNIHAAIYDARRLCQHL